MLASQKTYTPKGGEIIRAWRVVDAEGKALGRLASEIAGYLRGKHLPGFAEHLDVGDFVVVINAARVRVTGNKLRQKMYYSHSNYPGGFKAVALGDVLAKDPERVIRHAVRGMVPHTTLGRAQLKKLKVYAGAEHPHQAQLAGPQRPYRPKAKGAAEEERATRLAGTKSAEPSVEDTVLAAAPEAAASTGQIDTDVAAQAGTNAEPSPSVATDTGENVEAVVGDEGIVVEEAAVSNGDDAANASKEKPGA
jgi:large subunit ribosomal protein L13